MVQVQEDFESSGTDGLMSLKKGEQLYVTNWDPQAVCITTGLTCMLGVLYALYLCVLTAHCDPS